MGAQTDVRALLDCTYSLLVNDDCSLRPGSRLEMSIIAGLLLELEASVSTADDRRRFEALQALFDEHRRRSWHPSFPALIWATLLAGGLTFAPGQLPLPVPPDAAIAWLLAGIFMHAATSFYPNYLATGPWITAAGNTREVSGRAGSQCTAMLGRSRAGRLNVTALLRQIVVGLIEAVFLPVISVFDCITKCCTTNRLD